MVDLGGIGDAITGGITGMFGGGEQEQTDQASALGMDTSLLGDNATAAMGTDAATITDDASDEDELTKAKKKEREAYQERIDSGRARFTLHQGEIIETHTYDKIYDTSWDYDYEGMESSGSITIPFHKDDLKYIYKGVRCRLKTKRATYDTDDSTITIDDSEGYLCFITDVNISDNKLDLSLSGYDKLLEQENILSFTNQRRSTILEEVIKMAGFDPVIDVTGLPDEKINWSTEKQDKKDEENSTGAGVNVSGDGSMTEEEAWKVASSWGYGGSCSSHDPNEAWNMLGTKTGQSPDCYGATAWLYYVFNMKVGVPARDICYHSDCASSGSHHTIQLYRNGEWVDPEEYSQLHKYLGLIKSRDKSQDHVCREPPNNGTIPPYQKCPHSNNG